MIRKLYLSQDIQHGEGLAIVMNILKKYNAKIKVDSSDKETFFEIEFVKKGDGLL